MDRRKCNLNKSYLLGIFLNIKNKYYNENYITINEYEFIVNKLLYKLDENNIDVHINGEIDPYYFLDSNGTIILNCYNNIDLIDIINRYNSDIAQIDIMNIIWNERFISNCISSMRDKSIRNYEFADLSDILKKIFTDTSVLYERVANELSKEEYEYISNTIKKSCLNCLNDCKNNEICSRWENDIIIGKAKILCKF